MDKLKLMKTANEVRKGIVTSVHSAKAGHPGGSLSAADLIRKHPVIEKAAAADCFLYLGYLFFIWIDPYFYCPIYLSHPDSLYTDGLFQQVLYFKISFALSDILSSSIFLLYFITMISQKH